MSNDKKHMNLGRRPINRNQHLKEKQNEESYGNSHTLGKENEVPKIYPDFDEEDLDVIESTSDSSFGSNSKEFSYKDELEFKLDESTDFEGSTHHTANIFKLLIAIFFVIVGCFAYVSMPVNDTQKALNASAIVMDLKNEFKGQLPLSFRIMEKEINNVVFNPKSPAIIVLLVSSDAQHTARNFAHRVSSLVSKSEIKISIDGAKLKYMNINEAKLLIDNTLRTHLSKSQLSDSLGVIIVDNLQDIPFQAAMMFHSYCDHENAPFKNAVFMLVIQSDVKIPENADSKYIDKAAANCLTKAWNTEHEDQVFSLLSRLLVNVAFILPET